MEILTMNGDFSSMQIMAVRITETVLLCRVPVFLLSAVINAGSGGAGEANFYSGLDTNGVRMLDISAIAGATYQVNFSTPVLFGQGLYAVIGSNVDSLTILYAVKSAVIQTISLPVQ
jgi:hypothetical protein